jgi:cysteine desulfurase family protein (TIGR01976 family)
LTFPVERIRDHFPALTQTDEGAVRVYLDNPAGTQVPKQVADACAACLLQTNANLGGSFRTSRAAQSVVENAHRAMARFLGASSEREIVIGPSMTSLTFEFSRSLARTFSPGDEIVVTRMDHEGNVSPWLAIAEDRGLTIRWLPFDERTWRIEPDALERVLTKKTRLVALNHASNLTGSINDVKELTRRIHAAGALVYVDSVQYAPHRPIDVRDVGCDFLACSSYKFYGPHLGIVWGREELLHDLYAYKVRPQTSELPYKFETGTPQIEQLAGLSACVEYVEGGREVEGYEMTLTARLLAGLERLPGVRIIGIADPAQFEHRVPTVSFVHERHKPSEIARYLGERNIFVWSGHNFALEVVRQLGIDEDEGVVRIGIAHYNTAQEVDFTLEALESFLRPRG